MYLPYIGRIAKGANAIMLSLFEAACSPAQHSKSMYRQHKYLAHMTMPVVVNVFYDWKCIQRAISMIARSFFGWHVC